MTRLVAFALVLASCHPSHPPPAPTPPPLPDATAIDSGQCHLPDPKLTPGKLCMTDDPDFDGLRYPEQIPHCRRNITMAEKDQVARAYGLTRADYGAVEFDHFIPLNAGGSNDAANLWPQPLDEAHEKDALEDEVFMGLRAGAMTQAQAVARIRAWRPDGCR